MRKRRILLVTIGLAMLLGFIGTTVVGAEGSRRPTGAPAVQAQGSKFCLDGVLYEAEKLNRIVEELRSRGGNLLTVIYEDGDGCNFTSAEKCDEYAAKHGLHPCSEPPVMGQANIGIDRLVMSVEKFPDCKMVHCEASKINPEYALDSAKFIGLPTNYEEGLGGYFAVYTYPNVKAIGHVVY